MSGSSSDRNKTHDIAARPSVFVLICWWLKLWKKQIKHSKCCALFVQGWTRSGCAWPDSRRCHCMLSSDVWWKIPCRLQVLIQEQLPLTSMWLRMTGLSPKAHKKRFGSVKFRETGLNSLLRCPVKKRVLAVMLLPCELQSASLEMRDKIKNSFVGFFKTKTEGKAFSQSETSKLEVTEIVRVWHVERSSCHC